MRRGWETYREDAPLATELEHCAVCMADPGEPCVAYHYPNGFAREGVRGTWPTRVHEDRLTRFREGRAGVVRVFEVLALLGRAAMRGKTNNMGNGIETATAFIEGAAEILRAPSVGFVVKRVERTPSGSATLFVRAVTLRADEAAQPPKPRTYGVRPSYNFGMNEFSYTLERPRALMLPTRAKAEAVAVLAGPGIAHEVEEVVE